MLKCTTLLLSLCFAFQIHAMTLIDAWQLAKENSPAVKELNAKVEATSFERLKALSHHLPHLQALGHHLFNERFEAMTIDLGGGPTDFALPETYTEFSLRESWMFFDGLKSWRLYQAAELDHSASELEQERALFQLKNDIRLKFNEALAANLLTQVAEQNVEALQSHLNDIKVQLRTGTATRFDSLRTEVQLQDAKTDLLTAQDHVKLTEVRLAQALGLTALPSHPIGDLPLYSPDLAQSITSSLQDRADRQALILREQSSHKRVQSIEGSWIPELSLYAQQDLYNYNSHRWDEHFRDAYEVGMTLKWDLFDGGGKYAALRQESAKQAAASARLQAVTLAVPAEILSWKQKFTESLAIYRAAKTNVSKAQESVRLAHTGVRAGVQTQTDLLDAERDLNVARAKVIKAQIDSVKALNQLELAVGHRLQ